MAEVVYILCAATSIFCSALLFRTYRRQPSRLVLLSMLCFLGLALNGLLVVVDLMLLTDVDLRLARTLVAYVSILGFLLGLLWETR